MAAGASSATRGLICNGNASGGAVNIIEYVTIGSTGNTTDFGDATVTARARGAVSSTIRAVIAGGAATSTDTMDYVTIASTGNATDFGNLTSSKASISGASNSHGGLA